MKKIIKVLAGIAAISSMLPAASHAKMTLDQASEKITIDAEVRIRPEFRKDLLQAVPAVPGNAEEDFSVLLRSRFGLQFAPTEDIHFYIQMQDARDFGEEVASGTGILADDEGIDLHQGYIDFLSIADSNFNFRVGRQEMNLGDARLVGSVNWSNTGRSFDGALLSYDSDSWWFGLGAAMTNKTLAGDQQWFGTLYSSWKNVPADGVLDLYYMAILDNDGAAGVPAGTGNTLSLHTVGSRFKVNPGNFDFGLEGAAQFGKFGSNSIFAYAAHGKAGYTWKDTGWKPRVGIEGNYATGDDGGANTYTRFNNLLGTEHDKYGLIDCAVWSNLIDVSGGVSIAPESWTASLDYHLLMVADETDAFGFGGIAGGAGRRSLAGHEVDATVGYAINNSAKLLFGYSVLLPGGFLKDVGITSWSNLAYVQATASF